MKLNYPYSTVVWIQIFKRLYKPTPSFQTFEEKNIISLFQIVYEL